MSTFEPLAMDGLLLSIFSPCERFINNQDHPVKTLSRLDLHTEYQWGEEASRNKQTIENC